MELVKRCDCIQILLFFSSVCLSSLTNDKHATLFYADMRIVKKWTFVSFHNVQFSQKEKRTFVTKQINLGQNMFIKTI